MTRKLILASAGAGKSRRIAQYALDKAAGGQKVLILTYTKHNQKELEGKICKLNRYLPSNIIIKGWFTFLLEDMIRPYQRCIFKDRIQGINFNSSDPHKRNGRTIPGRYERRSGAYNPLYFLTSSKQKAHTTYLSKLATRIQKESNGKTTQRLSDIYNCILIDEVQDLIGWDFDIINAITKTDCSVMCVGDFRQTIYATAISQKKPKANLEKLSCFEKFGFVPEYMSISWRCIQPICDFADLVHTNENYYPATASQVLNVPNEYCDHTGIFVVSTENAAKYMQLYHPVILRRNRTTQTQLCDGKKAFNFGQSKGIGFKRVLIFPTEKHRKFLSGKSNVFEKDKTEKAKNTFYVAITRARYSVAFVFDGESNLSGVNTWAPG